MKGKSIDVGEVIFILGCRVEGYISTSTGSVYPANPSTGEGYVNYPSSDRLELIRGCQHPISVEALRVSGKYAQLREEWETERRPAE